jgi:hypothetical protein
MLYPGGFGLSLSSRKVPNSTRVQQFATSWHGFLIDDARAAIDINNR